MHWEEPQINTETVWHVSDFLKKMGGEHVTWLKYLQKHGKVWGKIFKKKKALLAVLRSFLRRSLTPARRFPCVLSARTNISNHHASTPDREAKISPVQHQQSFFCSAQQSWWGLVTSLKSYCRLTSPKVWIFSIKLSTPRLQAQQPKKYAANEWRPKEQVCRTDEVIQGFTGCVQPHSPSSQRGAAHHATVR